MELFRTSGVCARGIELEVENGIVKDIKFIGGCSGNTQGIASLVKGMNVEEVKRRLRGIRCGAKSTSCPDQLAQILENNF
ncbi:MAG: TIGR03905 family TSCPD domain-containing protein [Fusobacterium sp.]|nr:TIGR03905 family TSCPD domain-containing protein [Fusobacterium sp.]